ncbi:MAG: hypothetical protein LM522_13335, partial [Candidatus Contendobacter sp.]|nr:hypothetical protein [Candidatus Contendobacter sp.]
PDHNHRAAGGFRLTINSFVHSSAEAIEFGGWIRAQRRWRTLDEIASDINHDLRPQSAAHMTAHAIRQDSQQAVLSGRLENGPTILLFVTSALLAGATPLPWVGMVRCVEGHGGIFSGVADE